MDKIRGIDIYFFIDNVLNKRHATCDSIKHIGTTEIKSIITGGGNDISEEFVCKYMKIVFNKYGDFLKEKGLTGNSTIEMIGIKYEDYEVPDLIIHPEEYDIVFDH